MIPSKKTYITFLFTLLSFYFLQAQYGYGGNGYGYGGGRNRSAIPQAQESPKEVTPPTAEEIVEKEMPAIKEALNLNPFEEAVVSTILTTTIKKRMELRILQLPPEKNREAIEKIYKIQKQELESGLPEDKYKAFLKLQENGFKKDKKAEKKKKKKKK